MQNSGFLFPCYAGKRIGGGTLQYLIKPVSPEKLFGTIEKAVKKSALLIKEEPDVQPDTSGGDAKNQTDNSFLNNIMKWIQRKIDKQEDWEKHVTTSGM